MAMVPRAMRILGGAGKWSFSIKNGQGATKRGAGGGIIRGGLGASPGANMLTEQWNSPPAMYETAIVPRSLVTGPPGVRLFPDRLESASPIHQISACSNEAKNRPWSLVRQAIRFQISISFMGASSSVRSRISISSRYVAGHSVGHRPFRSQVAGPPYADGSGRRFRQHGMMI